MLIRSQLLYIDVRLSSPTAADYKLTCLSPLSVGLLFFFFFSSHRPSLHTVNMEATEVTRKIRITVQYAGSNGGPSKRYAIPMSPASTIGTLASEISRRHGQRTSVSDSLELTLADGSVLFDEDTIGDVVHSGETVYAGVSGSSSAAAADDDSEGPVPPNQSDQHGSANQTPTETQWETGVLSEKAAGKKRKLDDMSPEPSHEEEYIGGHTLPTAASKRVRILFVTPKLARNGGSKDSANICAFEGSAVSADLTMVSHVSCHGCPQRRADCYCYCCCCFHFQGCRAA